MKEEFLDRSLNEGFSGGEKKRNEILQMAVLEPKLAILDELDSGLDIDALRVLGDAVNKLQRPDRALLIITHFPRILETIHPSSSMCSPAAASSRAPARNWPWSSRSAATTGCWRKPRPGAQR